jgi:SOS-response transcriptional repressor LexA
MDAAGDRLKSARIAAGFKSIAMAARRLNKSQSTLRAHENGQNDFDAKWATLYGAAYKVDPTYLLFGEAGPLVPPEHIEFHQIPVRGTVAAGSWIETPAFLEEFEVAEFIEGLQLVGEDVSRTYALKVLGSSLNKIAPDGSFVICTDISSGVELRDGDLVVVERIRAQGGLREVTAKRVQRRNGIIHLSPESNDPRWQEAIDVSLPHNDESAEIRVVARIRHIIIEP